MARPTDKGRQVHLTKVGLSNCKYTFHVFCWNVFDFNMLKHL